MLTLRGHGFYPSLLAAIVPFAASAASAQSGANTLVSVSSAGIQTNDQVYEPKISANSRYVAFQGLANNLVPEDTNGVPDVFVHDGATALTTRVSVDSAGNEGNWHSSSPSISADGRYVAFSSFSDNLVPGDTNVWWDVFVHDRQTAQTTRVSVDSAGNQGNFDSLAPSISSDGRYVAFTSYSDNLVPGDSNDVVDVFVHDRATGQTTRVSLDSTGSQGNGHSFQASVSTDGCYVAFRSDSDNLVPGDTNGVADVFVHDRSTGQTARVSLGSAGTQGNGDSVRPMISANGGYVAFESVADNLVNGDTNGNWDVFVRDLTTAQTTRVSVNSAGAQGNSYSYGPSISADGDHIAFWSDASNLVPDETNLLDDVFVHDGATGVTTCVSVNSAGIQGNGYSFDPSISADGRYVAFWSYAYNLVPGDTNHTSDVYVHDEFDCTPATYCTAKVSSNSCVPSIQGSGAPSFSSPSGFTLSTVQMESQQNALTFFGISGTATILFMGGLLCVQPPIYRLNVQNTGGSAACQGAVSYTLADILANAAGGAQVVEGTLVYCQTWGRDPGDIFGISLSDALQFQACP